MTTMSTTRDEHRKSETEGEKGLSDGQSATQNGALLSSYGSKANNHEDADDVKLDSAAPIDLDSANSEPTSVVNKVEPIQLEKRTDVLYGLTVIEPPKPDRSFYQDSPWEGIADELHGGGTKEDLDDEAVLTYYVSAEVKDKTNKKSNTSKTWGESHVDFELGRDADLLHTFHPSVKIHSKRLVRVLGSLLDYYPNQGSFDFFSAITPGVSLGPEANGGAVVVAVMYCYAQLREYLCSYRNSLPTDQQNDPRFEIGNCGDEQIVDTLRAQLDFGALNMVKDPCDEATAYDIAVLLRLFAPMYQAKMLPTISATILSPNPTIRYKSLWALHKPGTKVYVQHSVLMDCLEDKLELDPHHKNRRNPDNDYNTCCVVAGWKYLLPDPTSRSDKRRQHHYELEMWNIQYDGVAFQRMTMSVTIAVYDQPKPIQSLPVVPVHYYDRVDGGALRQKLQRRGEKYLTILKDNAAHREYNHPRSGYNGQIIVDQESHRQYSNQLSLNLQGQAVPPSPPVLPINDNAGSSRLGQLTKFQPADSETFHSIDEVRLLLPRTVEGFGLKTKSWMMFEIDYISDKAPVPSPNQVDNELVLFSDEDKDVLRTVLPKGQHVVGQSPDFVAGKGEGQIFLLYGPPGTGKTLTVECVANDTRRPLLSLTAQDVGLANDVESRLRKYFTLAAKWDAILLIDEADLFLEQRREGDLLRNSLSTVFLRSMEYYKGVLFLTTNRPGHIDDSFISRITCPISYPHLSPETKGKVIKKFVARFQETGTVDVDQAAERYLVANCKELNGRQLRNVLQNAVASAEVQQRAKQDEHNRMTGDGETMTMVTVKMHHVKAAVARQGEFREYLKSLRGRDESARARNKQDYLSAPPGNPAG